MSLEQIASAEIRDFPPGAPGPIPFGLPSLRPPGDPLNKFMPQFPLMTSPRAGPQPHYDTGDDKSESAEKPSRPSSVASSASLSSNLAHNYPVSSFSASLAALEKHARSIEARMGGEEKERPLVMVRPFSRETSPDSRQGEEPQDLSRGQKSVKMSEDEDRSSSISDNEEEEEIVRTQPVPVPLSPSQPPLPLLAHLSRSQLRLSPC